jgi:hypothetical protein
MRLLLTLAFLGGVLMIIILDEPTRRLTSRFKDWFSAGSPGLRIKTA